jgi:hypothetical protein
MSMATDMRPRILCARDTFERVNNAVEAAGQSAVYNVQRSAFVRPGQVYLTGPAGAAGTAQSSRHVTVAEAIAAVHAGKA